MATFRLGSSTLLGKHTIASEHFLTHNSSDSLHPVCSHMCWHIWCDDNNKKNWKPKQLLKGNLQQINLDAQSNARITRSKYKVLSSVTESYQPESVHIQF